MATRAIKPVNYHPQGPDRAIHLYHFWDVAHRIRLDPVVLHSTAKAMELLEEEETAFLNLQCFPATSDLGKALQLRAWAIYHGRNGDFPDAEKMLENRRDLIGPHSFEKLLADFIATDETYKASDPDDEDTRDVTYDNRSNAMFSLFAAKPETIGQAREILRAAVHEFADSELTVGGPLPDSIELALRSILALLDRLDPKSGVQVQS
jgi:hypothetical protein